MAYIFAAMTAGKFLVAYIITLGNYCSTNNWRFERSFSAGAWLCLAVDHRTLFAKTHMTGLPTLMFSTVKHFGAVEFARMIVWYGGVSMGTTDLVTDVVAAVSLPFTN